MEKLMERLPLALFALFTGKLIILNSWSFESALVLAALAGVSGLFHLKAKNDEIKELRAVQALQAEEIEALKKQSESVRNTIAGMKMANVTKTAARF